MSLFGTEPEMRAQETAAALQPLAERMRPRTLDEVVGQEKLLGPGKPLRVQIENDTLSSMLFWGPPGCGKTTLARLIARLTKSDFVSFSAVLSGIKEIKEVMAHAERKSHAGRRTIVFVDEVHRFNKAQQDAFLPHVEAGHILFIGATTENPSFEVISPLLSRTKVYVLEALTTAEIVELLQRALEDRERGYGNERIVLEPEQIGHGGTEDKEKRKAGSSEFENRADMGRNDAPPRHAEEVLWRIAAFANGDARAAYNILELCVKSAGAEQKDNSSGAKAQLPRGAMSELKLRPSEEKSGKSAMLDRQNPPSHTEGGAPSSSSETSAGRDRRAQTGVSVPRADGSKDPLVHVKRITVQLLEEVLQKKVLRYDKAGEEHYNLISALHKSVRNSDPDAALYWLARMIESGEDPLYLARRMVRMASEDIGLAEPGALAITLAAKEAFDFLGAPEGHLALAQAAVYLSLAPKSNALYVAYGDVMEDVRKTEAEPVPLHLRNAVTGLMKNIGHGEGYKYAHDFEEKVTGMQCLPDNLAGRSYYRPTDQGFEARMRARMAEIGKIRKKVGGS
jgi:putative ATPase